jgi:hypothetical protein
MKRKRGRPRKHHNITVRQKDDVNAYQLQYYHKVKKKMKKKDLLPMGALFSKRDKEDPFPL